LKYEPAAAVAKLRPTTLARRRYIAAKVKIATVQVKPVIYTLPRCTYADLFFSFCRSAMPETFFSFCGQNTYFATAPDYTQRDLYGAHSPRGVLPASKLLLRAKLWAYRRASAIIRWAPSLRRWCATSTASAATASAAANNDEQLGRINVFYHGASGGVCVSRAVLFDLEPGVIGALRA
jgi:hypothetical protein